MNKFKIGDIVVNNDLDNPYLITNKEGGFVGKVVDLLDDVENTGIDINVEVLEHKTAYFTGNMYKVRSKHFKLKETKEDDLTTENKELLEGIERLDNPSLEKEKVFSLDVYFDDKKEKTLVIDGNGNFTTVKTMNGDKYDREKGFLLAYFQHTSGLSKTEANKYLKSFSEERD